MQASEVFAGSLALQDGSPWANIATGPGLVMLEGIGGSLDVSVHGQDNGDAIAAITHPNGRHIGLHVASTGEVVVTVVNDDCEIESLHPIDGV